MVAVGFNPDLYTQIGGVHGLSPEPGPGGITDNGCPDRGLEIRAARKPTDRNDRLITFLACHSP